MFPHRRTDFWSLTKSGWEAVRRLSHLEGAAYTFCYLSVLLEGTCATFFLAEPDTAPFQRNFLLVLLKHSEGVSCEQHW